MAIDIQPTGWQHSITATEIFAIIAYPLFRYAITTPGFEHLATFMFVGRINNETPIEVAANDVDGQTWAVFHAMLLTTRVANEVLEVSQGAKDLRNDVAAKQRPFIGPQYT
ncbi:hypothetical protein [Mycobacterium sp. DL440]|uniref:hypothetical protein n=1 Tax=Mycobacterium sp. DL440 TaxID=2675523 RepID=UPI0014212DF1|nr:hypothetical protein [Mycobacterium sp. DL440]